MQSRGCRMRQIPKNVRFARLLAGGTHRTAEDTVDTLRPLPQESLLSSVQLLETEDTHAWSLK
jgi:hypothetical protein